MRCGISPEASLQGTVCVSFAGSESGIVGRVEEIVLARKRKYERYERRQVRGHIRLYKELRGSWGSGVWGVNVS